MKTSLLALAAAVLLALAAMPSRAAIDYPWCAVSSSGGLGQPLCHFATLEQCMVFLSGLTGSCRPNPRAATQDQVRKRGAR